MNGIPRDVLSAVAGDDKALLTLVRLFLAADDEGVVDVPVRQLARDFSMPYSDLRHAIDRLKKNGILAQLTRSSRAESAHISFSNTDSYNMATRKVRAKSAQPTRRKDTEIQNEKPQDQTIVFEEFSDNPRAEEFENFNRWIDRDVPLIRQMREQLTLEQFCHLLDDVGVTKQELHDLINELGNKPKYVKDNISVNLTLQNWHRRDLKKNHDGTRKPDNPLSGSEARYGELLAYRAANEARNRTRQGDDGSW